MPDVIAVTEIYIDGVLVDKKAKVIKDPVDYLAWTIRLGIVTIGLWIMAIPMESWGFFE